MSQKTKSPTIVNRKARHEYHFIQTFEAGIVLKGTEVKSLREGKVQLSEAFCYFRGNELWVKEMHISPYSHGNIHNPDPARERKLLLRKRELNKLKEGLAEKGLTIIIHKLYFNDRNLAKLEIALAKGKKLFDKREALKERESKRDIDRQLKNYR